MQKLIYSYITHQTYICLTYTWYLEYRRFAQNHNQESSQIYHEHQAPQEHSSFLDDTETKQPEK